jgi:hypothetical protein
MKPTAVQRGMRRWAAAALLGLLACSDDGGSDLPADAGTDAGPTDQGAGDDAGPEDSGFACMPSGMMTGFGPCNPVDGTRCPRAEGTRCLLDLQTDEGSCTCLGNLGFLEPCSPGEQACGSGLVCADLGEGPICQKVCNRQPPFDGCEDLDPQVAFGCGAIAVDGMTNETFGLCQVLGTACDLLTNTCPLGENCTPTTFGDICLTVGTVDVNGACTIETPCRRDLVCVQVPGEADTTCQPVCDPAAPTGACPEPPGRTCRAFGDGSAGVCLP